MHNMDIIQAIKARHSVRSYNGALLEDAVKQELQAYAYGVDSPFGGRYSFRLRTFPKDGNLRPGTYGIIKGARDYFLIAYGDDMQSALSAGFAFEQVVLRATAMGLGTCWMGGTYRRETFDPGIIWPEGVTLKVVCPIGIPQKPRLFERMARKIMRSSSRLPFGSLFHLDNYGHPLPEDTAFAESLSMMRLAPSSVNSQPWRAVQCDDVLHLYCRERDKMSLVDMGIGLCHFKLTEDLKHNGSFFYADPEISVPDGTHYITSYRRE